MPEIFDYTDITRWIDKLGGIRGELYGVVIPKLVKEAHDEVKKKIVHNVSGPHYDPNKKKSVDKARASIGRMPIPRVSRALAGSIKSLKIEGGFHFQTIYKIWSDGRMAPHNIYVHFGTKGNAGRRGMGARRFIQEPVEERRPALFNRMKYEILKEIRKRGLA